MNDLMMSSAHGNGMHLCGIAPRTRLTTIDTVPCWNCEATNVVRRFSGSGWYEDDFLCATCGEDVGTGYRPFQRAWRKKNLERAAEWLASAIDAAEFTKQTRELVKAEMGWEDDPTPAINGGTN